MPALDIVDETFLTVPPKLLAAVFADEDQWPLLWPDLAPTVYADRGEEGLRWTVGGALVGTMEVWLQPMLDGTLLHFFLRADLPSQASPRAVRAERRRRQLAAKRMSLGLKVTMEDGRAPGCPP